ncbi:MAG: NAD(P)H-hydrate dehydratase [Anaerolineae bacterium]
MKLVSVDEMREIERASDAAGLSYAEMMERAGQAVASAISDRLGSLKCPVLVLVGPGNNGGDGLVAARQLALEGHDVVVYLWKRSDVPGDPLLDQARAAGIATDSYASDAGLAGLSDASARCDVLVDALLGTGATGPLRDGAAEILSLIATSIARRRLPVSPALRPVGLLDAGQGSSRFPVIVAVDVPSGLDADTGEIDPRALKADLCVTFAHPKRGHFRFPGAAFVGELLVADIGTLLDAADHIATSVATRAEIAVLLPERPLDSHKGTYGRVLIIAGSINYVGAPALAARAAYRIGAGLATLAIPAPIQVALASQLPEATYLPLPNDMGVIAPTAVPLLAERIQGYHALLLGPGITQEEPTREFVRTLLDRHSGGSGAAIGFVKPRMNQRDFALPPTVLDADALNLLARMPSWWDLIPEQTVLTPHPAEMARLLGSDPLAQEKDRVVQASEAALKWACTVVLKGAYTVVASPGRDAAVIPFAEPALATAGTGDVLAGAVAGLLAQGLECYEAAVCGAYLHALAGAMWARDYGHAGMLASDLAERLPAARNACTSG